VLLQRRYSIPLTYMIFDVLSIEGDTTASQPYSERRLILEELNRPLADVAAVRRWRGAVECLLRP
jgi:ATP-dependent DNA ligase